VKTTRSFPLCGFALVLALAVPGCAEGPVPVSLEEHGFGDERPVDVGAAPFRERRRMDIAQVDASLRRVTGGIGWDVGSTNQFVRFDDTLGVPDYINSTAEDRAISLIFLKFLDDAARSVCRRVADREGGDTPLGTFAPVDVDAESPAPADVDAALVSLLLRFHGRRVTPGSAALGPWRTLHARAAAEVAASLADPDRADLPPRRAWETVCVALVDHPDFYTY
jgi:hypothetical protein